jgi:hypothetical protein
VSASSFARGKTRLSALDLVEVHAQLEGPERTVHVRVAGHEERIYPDLADARWRAIEISAEGWRVVESPPVRFRRLAGMLEIPVPEAGGSIEESFFLATQSVRPSRLRARRELAFGSAPSARA